MSFEADLYLRFKYLHWLVILFREKLNFCFQRPGFVTKICFPVLFLFKASGLQVPVHEAGSVQQPERAREMQYKINSPRGGCVHREKECKYIKAFCITDNQIKLFCQYSARQIISIKVIATFPI